MRVALSQGQQPSVALRTSLLTLCAQPTHHKVEPWRFGDRGTSCPQLPLLEGGCLAGEAGGVGGCVGFTAVGLCSQQKRLSLWAAGRGPPPPALSPCPTPEEPLML